MAKFKVEFEGFDQVLAKLKKLDGDAKTITEKALQETHKIVTEKAHIAIAPHRRTGKTEESLVENPKVEWEGTTANISVGFDLKNGGLPSIFLMYGTPRMEKDQKLYNAFYGAAIRKEVHAAQEQIFWDEIRRLEG